MLKESTNPNGLLEYKKLSQEEMQRRGILGRLVGICADFLHPTRNDRKYSEDLWEKVFDDPIMQEKIENKVCFGELAHPADREEIDPSRAAICLAEIPQKGKDGKLRAVFDILDTPSGRILKTMCDYGSHLGISSRGSGDLYTDYNGEEAVDPDSYSCECFDIVLIPGVKEARLAYVNEALNVKRYNKTLKQKLEEQIKKASEEDRKIMQESLNNLLTESSIVTKGGTFEPETEYEIVDTGYDQMSGAQLYKIKMPDGTQKWLKEADAKYIIDKDAPPAEEEVPVEEDTDSDEISPAEWESFVKKAYKRGIPKESLDDLYEKLCGKTLNEGANSSFDDYSEEINWLNNQTWVKTDLNTVFKYNGVLFNTQEEEDDFIDRMTSGEDSYFIEDDYYDFSNPEDLNDFCNDHNLEPDEIKADYIGFLTLKPGQGLENIRQYHSSDEYNSQFYGQKDEQLESGKKSRSHKKDIDECGEAGNSGDVLQKYQESLVKVNRLSKDNLDLQEKLSVCNAKVKQLNEELNRYKKSTSNLSEQVRSSNKKLSEHNSLRESLNNKSNEVLELTKSLNKMEDKLDRLSKSNNNLRSKISQINEELSQSNSKANVLSEKLSKANSNIKTYKKVLSETRNKLIETKAEFYGLSVDDLKSTLNESYKLSELDAECARLVEQKRNLSRLPFRVTPDTKVSFKPIRESINGNNSGKYDDDNIDNLLKLL